MRLYVDIETYHPLGISGVSFERYVKECDVLLVATLVENDGEFQPPVVFDMSNSSDVAAIRKLWCEADEAAGFNAAAFDVPILSRFLGIEPPPVFDIMHLCYSAGLGGDLDSITEYLRDSGLITFKKLDGGKKLVRVFCQDNPKNYKTRRYTCANKPNEWREFVRYAAIDVAVLPQIVDAVQKIKCDTAWRVDVAVRKADYAINRRGVPIDVDLCRAAIELSDRVKRRELARFAELTGGLAPTQTAKLLAFLRGNGVLVSDLRADNLRLLLANNELQPEIREIVEMRIALARNSAAKYESALREAEAGGGRARWLLVYYGASTTGRWAGRRIQIQNMARSERVDELCDRILAGDESLKYAEIAEAVRGIVKAPDGCMLVSGDLANIEGRVLAWIAGQDDVLAAYERGDDLYKFTYSRMFGVPIEKVTKDQRFIGKVLYLACQYYGGGSKVAAAAEAMGGVKLDDADKLVERWRHANKYIVKFWHAIKRAWDRALTNPNQVIRFGRGNSLAFCYAAGVMRLKLPSGRALYYHSPDEESYYNTARKRRVAVHGGVLTENVAQAVSRDVLAHTLVLWRDRYDDKWPIVFSVHDEIVIEAPEKDGEAALEELLNVLRDKPFWANDLPVDASGWIGTRYKKD